MNIVYINTKNELMDLISAVSCDEKINRFRSTLLFRGLPRVEYKLKTSLERNCDNCLTIEKIQSIESSILANFSKYALIEDESISSSIWKQLIIGQHHGLPTRLLDWTQSILVALHFATTESNYDEMDKHDCVVWQIDTRVFKNELPDKYKQLIGKGSNIFPIDSLDKGIVSLESYDESMKECNSMIVMEPPSIDQRIINQYAFFTVVPLTMANIDDSLGMLDNSVKYIISKDLRWYIRDLLDQFNISERTIYPGLDGTAKWIARHYYVKKK